jgi:hypothetical protein
MKAAKALAGVLLLAGCSTGKSVFAPNPDTEDVSVILNYVRGELRAFQDSKQETVAGPSICMATGAPKVVIVPANATVGLNVVATNSISGDVGAKIPVGTILKIDPKFSASYQDIGTQKLSLDLDIRHAKTAAEYQADADAASKKIEAYNKAKRALTDQGDRMVADKYAAAIEMQKKNLQQIYREEAATLNEATDAADLAPADAASAPNAASASGSSNKLPPLKVPPDLVAHKLAAALWLVREGLLRMDHNVQPCVKPHQLKVEIDFEVVTDKSGGVGFDVYIVSLDASVEHKLSTVQTLSVTFDMTGSSPAMNPM